MGTIRIPRQLMDAVDQDDADRCEWLASLPDQVDEIASGGPTHAELRRASRHDPVGLSRRVAGLLGVDPGRVRLWLFARCVQESRDDPTMRNPARRRAALARPGLERSQRVRHGVPFISPSSPNTGPA